MTLRAKLVLSISVWLTILLGLLAVAHAAVRLWTLEGATATLAARDLISALVAASIVLCVLTVGVAALAARRLFAPMTRAFADAQHAVREDARCRPRGRGTASPTTSSKPSGMRSLRRSNRGGTFPPKAAC